jgi:Putative transmembrane protein (Alph_Pro_TM)
MLRHILARASGLLFALALLPGARAAAAEAPDLDGAVLRVEPAEVAVGMFYRGTTIHVEATAPAAGKVALVCAGHEGKVELKRKGKVGGVLWMNVGDVRFERVPSLFLYASELDGARSDGAAAAEGSPRGYEGVEARVLPASADEETRRLFREFIRLKEHERLYVSRAVPARSTANRVSADFFLPASIPAGQYEVQLLAAKADGLEVLASRELTVKRAGLAALISNTAQRHGLVYGILSVVVAIGMGFFTGVLFKASKKGH